MARHIAIAPDGSKHVIEGPDNATPQEVLAQAKRLMPSSPAMAAVRGFNAGMSSNFADEAAAALESLVPIDKLHNPNIRSVWDGASLPEAFGANMKIADQEKAADRQSHPVASGVGAAAGTVAQVFTLTKLLSALRGAQAAPKATTALQRITSGITRLSPSAAVVPGALGAAAYGAAGGAGEGDTLGNRFRAAKAGAATGAVIGAPIAGTVAHLAPAVAHYWNVFFGGAKGVTDEAMRQLTRALQRDGYDVTSPAGKAALQSEVTRLQPRGGSLADVGPAARSRTGVALRTPSAASSAGLKTVVQRQQGSADRINSDIKTNVSPRTDVYTLNSDLLDQREATALPYKQAALSTPTDPAAPVTPEETRRWIERPEVRAWLEQGATGTPPTVPIRPATVPVIPNDPVIQRLMQLPLAQRAVQSAATRADAERGILEAQGLDTSHLPQFPAEGAPLDMHALDYTKRYLDDWVHKLYSGDTSAAAADATVVRQLRDALRGRMRAAVPAYGHYLDTYSDVSGMREALAAGKGGASLTGEAYPKLNQMDPEAIAAAQAKRSAPEQELYRAGVARQYTDIVNGVKDTGLSQPAERLLTTPADRARLAATGVGPWGRVNLEGALEDERQLGQLTHEITGSATAGRLAAQEDANGVPTILTPSNPRNPGVWAAFGLRKLLQQANLQHNAAVNEALLPRALDNSAQGISDTIDQLEKAGQYAQARALRRAAAARFGTQVIGSPIGAGYGDMLREDNQ